MKKKIIAIALALCMVTSLLPATVLAASEGEPQCTVTEGCTLSNGQKDSGPVIETAIKLAEARKLEEIRTVVVPDYLNNEETVDQITRVLSLYLEKMQIRYRISAYRPFGVREPYRSEFRVPTHEELERLAEIARNNGFSNLVLI